MKILQKVFYMLIAALALVSCDRDYDAPPLNEPKYDGPKANITIASSVSYTHLTLPTTPYV